jgi:hypothetical protein
MGNAQAPSKHRIWRQPVMWVWLALNAGWVGVSGYVTVRFIWAMFHDARFGWLDRTIAIVFLPPIVVFVALAVGVATLSGLLRLKRQRDRRRRSE